MRPWNSDGGFDTGICCNCILNCTLSYAVCSYMKMCCINSSCMCKVSLSVVVFVYCVSQISFAILWFILVFPLGFISSIWLQFIFLVLSTDFHLALLMRILTIILNPAVYKVFVMNNFNFFNHQLWFMKIHLPEWQINDYNFL